MTRTRLTVYNRWFNFGALLASIVLNSRALVDPYEYKTSIYIEFAMIGISVIMFIFLPESPCK